MLPREGAPEAAEAAEAAEAVDPPKHEGAHLSDSVKGCDPCRLLALRIRNV